MVKKKNQYVIAWGVMYVHSAYNTPGITYLHKCLALNSAQPTPNMTTLERNLYTRYLATAFSPSEIVWSNGNKTTLVTAEVILFFGGLSRNRFTQRPLLWMSNCQRPFPYIFVSHSYFHFFSSFPRVSILFSQLGFSRLLTKNYSKDHRQHFRVLP